MKCHIERWDNDAGEWRWVAGFADPQDMIGFLYSYKRWRSCSVLIDGRVIASGRQYSMTVPRSVFMDHVRTAAVENPLTA